MTDTDDGESNFIRINGSYGHTWGEWECPDCGAVVKSDNTTHGLDCPECGSVVVSK